MQQDIYLSLFIARRWSKWRATRTRSLACVRVLSTAAACCKRTKNVNTGQGCQFRIAVPRHSM